MWRIHRYKGSDWETAGLPNKPVNTKAMDVLWRAGNKSVEH